MRKRVKEVCYRFRDRGDGPVAWVFVIILLAAFVGLATCASGCGTLSQIVTDLRAVDAKLTTLQAEQRDIESSKFSQASAQVIAANRTLKSDPEASRFVQAASPALDVAQSGLPTPTAVDLLAAMDIQAQFLAGQVKEAQIALGVVQAQITEKDKKLAEMRDGIAKLVQDKQEAFKDLDEKARIIDEENRNSWNPFHGFLKGLKRLIGWIIAFVTLGFILRVASFFFPRLEVVRWVGRLMVYPFKLILVWIPDALRAFGAVKHEEFLREKAIADRAVGAIQEFKDADKAGYESSLRPKLLEWMGDKPELTKHIEMKLVELNLKPQTPRESATPPA